MGSRAGAMQGSVREDVDVLSMSGRSSTATEAGHNAGPATGEAGQTSPPAPLEDLRISTSSGTRKSSSGARKRRASPEVVVEVARTPRTPASESPLLDQSQSQSPVKKQRTDGILALSASSSQPFASSGSAVASASSAPVAATTTTIFHSLKDTGLASTTADFAQLSTVTPAGPRHADTPDQPASATISPTASASPRRPVPVVEIPYPKSRSVTEGLASSSVNNTATRWPTPSQKRGVEAHNGGADPALLSDSDEDALAAQLISSSQVSLKDHSSPESSGALPTLEDTATSQSAASENNTQGRPHEASPELEDTSPAKKRTSRLSSPALPMQTSSSDGIDADEQKVKMPPATQPRQRGTALAERPVSFASLADDVEDALPPQATPSENQTKLSEEEYGHTSLSALKAIAALPWSAEKGRRAATQKKSYNENDDDSAEKEEEEDDSLACKSEPKKSRPQPSRKGKGRETSEIVEDEQEPSTKSSRTKAKVDKSSRTRKPRSQGSLQAKVDKGKRPLAKSRSETTLSVGKVNGRRARATADSDTSIDSDFVGAIEQLSPPKKAKVNTAKPRASTSKAKDAKPKAKAAGSVSLVQAVSGDDSDDSLPPMPGSSQIIFPTQSQREFSIYDLEEDVVVTLAAKRKAGNTSSPAFQASARDPSFWWPARIVSRNPSKFTVKLVLDEPDQSILQYSGPQVVVPPEDLTEDHIRSVHDPYTRHPIFPEAVDAFADVLEHSESEIYETPSHAAYGSALRQSLKTVKAEFKEAVANSPAGKKSNKRISKGSEKTARRNNANGKGARLEAARSASDLSDDSDDVLRTATQIAIVDSEEDSDSDIEVGISCLAKDRNGRYWPARILKVEAPSKVRPVDFAQKSKSKAKGKGYRYDIEFYPYSIKCGVARKDLVFKDDDDFFTVPLGEMGERHVQVGRNLLREILPLVVETARGKYKPGQQRHDVFFSDNPLDRQSLSRMAEHGAFTELQIQETSDYIMDWALGRPDADSPVPEDATFRTLSDESEKTDYVVGVLIPVALELLAMRSDETSRERAIESLRKKSNAEPAEDEISMAEHAAVANDLAQESTIWWQSVLNLRRMRDQQNLLKQGMCRELSAQELFDIHSGGGRRRNHVSYKE